jgi:hypothetical protein
LILSVGFGFPACGAASLQSEQADEGLIRQAALTETEIMTFDADEVPVFTGAASITSLTCQSTGGECEASRLIENSFLKRADSI